MSSDDEQPKPPSFQAVNKMNTRLVDTPGANGISPSGSSRATTTIVFLGSPAPGSVPATNLPNTGFQIPATTSVTENARTESARTSPRSSEGRSDGEAPRPPVKSKKKKGQKFFCRGYGNCNLSFTRSEHLARHIRKHTGERPFNCHCGRAFSRLDNLRQHSSTVHADEPIPDDSLAAVSSRYQRHHRTDRARPTARHMAARVKARPGPDQKPPTPGHGQPPAPSQPQQPLRPSQASGSFVDLAVPFSSESWGASSPVKYQGPSQVPQTPRNPALHAAADMHPRIEPRQRNRPEPITLPDITTPGPFEQYRNNTPPESPASVIGSRENSFYMDRRPSFNQPLASNMTTPTSATFTGANESPISSPIFPSLNSGNSSVINSPVSTFSPTPTWAAGRHPARRLSVSGVTLAGLGERTLPIPTLTPGLRYRHPAGSPSTAASMRARAGSLISPEEEEEKIKRRRTWHESNYELSAARELFSSTREGGALTLSGHGSIIQSGPQLPGISALLHEGTPPSRAPQVPLRRAAVEPEPARDLDIRMSSPGGSLRTMSARAFRGHTRSQSDDFMSGHSRHDRRWGSLGPSEGYNLPWSEAGRDPMVQPKPWDGVNTRRGQGDTVLRLNSSRHHDSQRLAYSYPHSTNNGAGQSVWGRKRCHRDSIGSGEDTSGSEGVATPSTNEELHPGIVGEGTAEVDEPHMSPHKAMPIAMASGNPTPGTRADTSMRESVGTFGLDALVSAAAIVAAEAAAADNPKMRR